MMRRDRKKHSRVMEYGANDASLSVATEKVRNTTFNSSMKERKYVKSRPHSLREEKLSTRHQLSMNGSRSIQSPSRRASTVDGSVQQQLQSRKHGKKVHDSSIRSPSESRPRRSEYESYRPAPESVSKHHESASPRKIRKARTQSYSSRMVHQPVEDTQRQTRQTPSQHAESLERRITRKPRRAETAAIETSSAERSARNTRKSKATPESASLKKTIKSSNVSQAKAPKMNGKGQSPKHSEGRKQTTNRRSAAPIKGEQGSNKRTSSISSPTTLRTRQKKSFSVKERRGTSIDVTDREEPVKHELGGTHGEDMEKTEEGQELVLDEQVLVAPATSLNNGKKGRKNKNRIAPLTKTTRLRVLLVPPDVEIPDGEVDGMQIAARVKKQHQFNSTASNLESTNEPSKRYQSPKPLDGKSRAVPVQPIPSAKGGKQASQALSVAEDKKTSSIFAAPMKSVTEGGKSLLDIGTENQLQDKASKPEPKHESSNSNLSGVSNPESPETLKNSREIGTVDTIMAKAYKKNVLVKGGISFKNRADGAIIISNIAKGGLFAETPLEVGDEVVQINNNKCRGKSAKNAASIVREAEGEVKVLAKRMQVTTVTEVVNSTLPFYSVTVTKKSISSKSGLEVQVDGNGMVVVSKVHSNGLFSSTALKNGDQIISINSVECKGMHPRQIASLFDKVDGAITVWGKKGIENDHETPGGRVENEEDNAVDVVVQSTIPNNAVKLTKMTMSAGFGLQIRKENDGRMVVTRVRDDPKQSSPFLQKGDEILTVNSVDCQGKDVNEVARLFGGNNGAVTVLAKRGGNDGSVTKVESKDLSEKTKCEEIADQRATERTFFVCCGSNTGRDTRDDQDDAETAYTAFTERSSIVDRSPDESSCGSLFPSGNEGRDDIDGAESTFTGYTAATSVIAERPEKVVDNSTGTNRKRRLFFPYRNTTGHHDGEESKNTEYASKAELYSL